MMESFPYTTFVYVFSAPWFTNISNIYVLIDKIYVLIDKYLRLALPTGERVRVRTLWDTPNFQVFSGAVFIDCPTREIRQGLIDYFRSFTNFKPIYPYREFYKPTTRKFEQSFVWSIRNLRGYQHCWVKSEIPGKIKYVDTLSLHPTSQTIL